MLLGVTRRIVHGSAADVLLLERLMPQRRVRRVVTREGRIDRHWVVDLVRQAIDYVVVALVNIEL